MSGEPSPELSVSSWRQVDEVCDQFEKAWRSGQRPSIEQFLQPAKESVRGRLLRELILTEVEYRRIAGEVPSSGEYLARFSSASDVVRQIFQSSLAETALQIDDLDSHFESDGRHRNGQPEPAVDADRTGTTDPNVGRTIGVYRLVEPLGRGGMGNVYHAAHTAIESQRAVKLLRSTLAQTPQAIQRFLREAQAAITGLSHPNIVKTFDLLREADEFYLVMELIDGCNLAQLVEQKGAMPLYQAVQVVEQAASGLAYAHEKGFIHRDIKPHNLMLATDGLVKILDLGLVHAIEDAESTMTSASQQALASGRSRRSTKLTESQSLLGTLQYISPEQARDSHAADARSDLYSLGCTLYFLLTGENAFSGAVDEVLDAVLNNRFRSPRAVRPEIPPSLEEIVLKLMSAEPQTRFASAKQLERALRSWRLQDRLEDGQVSTESMDYESVEELGAILQRLQIVSETDWSRAQHMVAHRGWAESSETTMIAHTYIHDRLLTRSSEQSPSRVLDALGIIHRDDGPARGLSLWQREAVTNGNADLLRLPHHVLSDKVGFGWKGEVFLTRCLDSNQLESVRTFAASALTGLPGDEPERLIHFVEEAERIAAVKHRAFAKVHSFDTCHNRVHPRLAYLATEWIEGTDSAEFLQMSAWPSQRDRTLWALRTAAEIARALHVAHQHGVLHLDIQNKSLRILPSGDVKIVDLGIAQMVTQRRLVLGADYFAEPVLRDIADEVPSVMVEAPSLGTPTVMPPEQWIDRANVSPATDVYNLGCVLCFWMTGSYPFRGAEVRDLMKDVMADTPWQPPREIPPVARPVLAKMLAKQPKERFHSAAELAEALDTAARKLSAEHSRMRIWVGRLWKRLQKDR